MVDLTQILVQSFMMFLALVDLQIALKPFCKSNIISAGLYKLRDDVLIAGCIKEKQSSCCLKLAINLTEF